MDSPQRRLSINLPNNSLPTENEVEQEANRTRRWPASIFTVANCEKPKFYRMAAMFFLIAYIYSVLRDTKDAVVMERQEPASISFLKMLFVTPCSIISVFIIQKALTKTTVGNVLKYMMCIFGTYFVLYSVVLLPAQSIIEPSIFWAKDMFGDGKMSARGLQSVLALMLTLNFWTSSLLYVTSELWGNLILSLLFMSFSNDICSFKQSLRFVPIFYIVSNLGLFLSGLTMLVFYLIQENATYAINQYVINSVFFLGGIVCVGIFLIQHNLETNVLPYPIFQTFSSQKNQKSKQKVGFAEGFKYMLKSKVLLQMCFIVLSYNICTNLIDTVFKATMKADAVKNNLSVSSSVMKTQAINQIVISLCVITLLSTPFSKIIQTFGWRFAGFITPIWAITCCFMVLILSIYNTSTEGKNQFGILNSLCHGNEDLILYEKIFGMLAAGGLKTCKYAAFDIAIEALSMRIAKDDRAISKGIYAGICGKLGKSGGSIMTIVILTLSNAVDLRCASQFCFVIIVTFCAMWMYAVKYLGFKYNESIDKKQEINITQQKGKMVPK